MCTGKQQGRKLMVAQTAPAVRVAIAETLGLPPGAVKPGQLVTGLKMLGFDYVFGEQHRQESRGEDCYGQVAVQTYTARRWRQQYHKPLDGDLFV
jgi:iron only hydrogenase large subunit-like protein